MERSLFTELFQNFDGGLKTEDREKARALLAVVTKSSASLADVVKLADELGLQLKFQALSKPEPKPESETKEA